MLLALPGHAAAAAATAAGQISGPFTRAGQWMADSQGRVVLLHGFDIVHKIAPYYPSTFTAQDAAFLAGEGFTTARIGFIWAGVEPKPGVYDDTYVEHMIRFNQLLARYGIHTLVDFHQDAWGGSSSSADGAPAWATLGGGDFLQSFQDFWDNAPAADGVGIQTHFDRAWRHVIALIDRSPGASNIVGLDPFNEPYAGTSSPCVVFTPCPSFESGALADFYRGVITSIRSAGDRHVIFPEGIAQNGLAQPSLPKFADPQTAFSFHYYCTLTQTATSSNPVADSGCVPHRDTGVGNFVAYARSLGVPAFEGEFSCNDDDVDNANTIDLFDRDLLSWTIWQYHTYAQDPANCAGQGLLIDDAKPGSETNAKQPKLDALVVPHPQAVAGTPGTFAFDRSSNTMTFSYTATAVPGARLARGALTQIFVPTRKYPTGYTASVTGGRSVSKPTAAWLMIRAAAGSSVSVTIKPRTGSFTARPHVPLALKRKHRAHRHRHRAH